MKHKMKHKINWMMLWPPMISLVLWGLLIWVVVCIVGCSWQGQKHQTFDNTGAKTQSDEFWSMRFLWMSGGVEAYNSTPYWTTGFTAVSSKSDPDSTEAIVQGVVEGAKGL